MTPRRGKIGIETKMNRGGSACNFIQTLTDEEGVEDFVGERGKQEHSHLGCDNVQVHSA